MNYERGKKIFYNNFGCYEFIRRNGEFSEYKKCGISKNDEEVWKEDIINDITQKIISGEDVGLIWNLSYMDISNSRKLSLYDKICKNGDKEQIKNKIVLFKNLFDKTTYDELINIFS